MVNKKNLISQEWYEKITTEIALIKDEYIPETLEILKDARSQWDLSENSDYHAAKEKLALLQRRISELEDLIEHVEIICNNEKAKDNIVRYWSNVLLGVEWDEPIEISIVWPWEVTIFDQCNISFESPLWASIEWKKQWDIVSLKLANIIKKVEILSVS
jgi:transcription elongation factor GreA